MEKMLKNNSGIVLVFVLAITLAMSAMVLFFQHRSKVYIDTLARVSISTQMDYFAEMGIEIGKEIIRLQEEQEKSSFSVDRNWPKEKNYELKGMCLNVKIEDENAKINPNSIFGTEKGEINSTLQDIFNTFFTVTGYSVVLRDSLLDWIDEDDIPRDNGAESFYYRTEGFSYTPSNRCLYTPEEILLIRDVSEDSVFDSEVKAEEKKKTIINFMTVVSDGKINVNRCAPEILRAIGFTSANVEKILSERETRPLDEKIIMNINKEVYIKNKSAISFKSNYYCVSSNVSDNQGFEKTMKVYLYRDDKKINILRWTII